MKKSYWFVLQEDNLLLAKTAAGYSIPYSSEPPLPANGKNIHCLQEINGTPCCVFAFDSAISPTNNLVFINLRTSYDYLELPFYQMAGKARQLIHWDKNSQFCPACGVHTQQTGPICKRCPQCQQEFYPVINTAIIVLIRRENSILLVHARNFRGSFHGLVAGFLEVGETLEECVKREVWEETKLKIKNIRYFGSQSWPYPSGLMVGFVADYESGEIKLQNEELSSGSFFTKDNLPEIPKKLSIARKLIDWWLNQENMSEAEAETETK